MFFLPEFLGLDAGGLATRSRCPRVLHPSLSAGLATWRRLSSGITPEKNKTDGCWKFSSVSHLHFCKCSLHPSRGACVSEAGVWTGSWKLRSTLSIHHIVGTGGAVAGALQASLSSRLVFFADTREGRSFRRGKPVGFVLAPVYTLSRSRARPQRTPHLGRIGHATDHTFISLGRGCVFQSSGHYGEKTRSRAHPPSISQ
ncbi:hypothetical protein HJG60_008124 [Phyllostomus discolor]|uniref:Uncharacterized protein n=1 Tax=Phyllostomus discolor TaxID=89673 RepID=A0A833Z8K7_9CHIR|nr:hypothetical protein HJG60_008124 [Phyllostomus discolor]